MTQIVLYIFMHNKEADSWLKQIDHDSSPLMWLRVQVYAYKELSALSTTDQELDFVSL